MGGKSHTPFPFQLLYRVCALTDASNDNFNPFSPECHTFPPLPLSPHTFLLVSVATLPRLPRLPEQLAPSTDTSTSRFHESVNKRSRGQGANERSKGQSAAERSRGQGSNGATEQLISAPLPLGVGRLARESPKEGFPFSPPLPSPLSPKLLMGLADTPTPDPSRPLLSNSGGGDDDDDDLGGVVSVERALQAVTLTSDPTPVPAEERSNGVGGGGGAVPPAACSPAPFSRMRSGGDRGGVKRRSCAISCRVSGADSFDVSCLCQDLTLCNVMLCNT